MGCWEAMLSQVFCFVEQCLWPCNQHLGWLEVLTCSTYGWTTALYWGAISSSTTRAVALGNQAKLSFLLDCLTSVAQPTMSEQHAGGWKGGTRLLFWQFSRLDALMLTWETKMQINFRLRDHFRTHIYENNGWMLFWMIAKKRMVCNWRRIRQSRGAHGPLPPLSVGTNKTFHSCHLRERGVDGSSCDGGDNGSLHENKDLDTFLQTSHQIRIFSEYHSNISSSSSYAHWIE